MSYLTPEAQARLDIDRQLTAAGWTVQSRDQMDLFNHRAVAVREFALTGGFADYLLIVDKKAIGVVEAKAVGTTLSGITHQAQHYSAGLPGHMKAWHLPLPYLYQSTGVETTFRDNRDPEPRSRRVFTFHRPETLVKWVEGVETLRARLRTLPALPLTGGRLWGPQVRAISGLEASLAADRPRALIQMATGSGKTYTAISAIYRQIKQANIGRVLFLVDRTNLGLQAYKEFQAFEAPQDGRKFTELYNVQHLTSNQPNPANDVYLTTIQRFYSILKGEPEFDPALEQVPLAEQAGQWGSAPLPVVYNAKIPIEFFDLIVIDECHRSIYHLWRQVLEYFDAYLVGLTATPSSHTYSFFNQNLVMEYDRRQAVADGINVDCQVYRIRTRITAAGASIDPAQTGYGVTVRDRRTRQERWQDLDEELVYAGKDLDQTVVNESQIRTVIRAFKERLFSEIYPGREVVPKTIIFAKDDAHAEEIQRIVKEEFGKGDAFCQKITYKVSGVDPEQLIQDFRTDPAFRIAVTVDMIAAGTDIKPVEIVMFMRLVKSASLFEQMLGRGTRIIPADALRGVTWDAPGKDHFVIVDTVGVVEHPKLDTKSLDRQPFIPFKRLLELVSSGADDESLLSSLAGRLARLAGRLTPADEQAISAASQGQSLAELATVLLHAVDPDRHLSAARQATGLADPPAEAIEAAAAGLRSQAAALIGGNVALRTVLLTIQERNEQVLDTLNLDELVQAGFDRQATDLAGTMIQSFRDFLEQKKDELDALQLIYNMPALSLRGPTLAERRAAYTLPLAGESGEMHASGEIEGRRLTFEDLKTLEAEITRTRPAWTTEALWNAYARLKNAPRLSGPRRLTNLISLIRAVVQLEDELIPYPDRVQQRYQDWLAAHEAAGHRFTPAQQQWLDRIAEVVGVNLAFTRRDFNDYFQAEGGLNAANKLFGKTELAQMLDELNEALV